MRARGLRADALLPGRNDMDIETDDGGSFYHMGPFAGISPPWLDVGRLRLFSPSVVKYRGGKPGGNGGDERAWRGWW